MTKYQYCTKLAEAYCYGRSFRTVVASKILPTTEFIDSVDVTYC